MDQDFRSFVQIELPVGSYAAPIEAIGVGHFTGGPHDGMARFEVSFRGEGVEPIVVALGPVAATKLGAALLAASFDHRAHFERWRSDE